MVALTSRWTPLRHHPEQWRLWNSRARFKVVPAGRRSGKTEIAKRLGVLFALGYCGPLTNVWVVFAAPTESQALNIFWQDLIDLIPKKYVRNVRLGNPHHSIFLINGVEISVVGLDKPQRIEGRPIDWICIDETAATKRDVWGVHIRPGLSTSGRLGQAMFIGVPRGRNHYFQLYDFALRERVMMGDAAEWDVFHWKSSDILDPKEIERARHELDALTFQQEYEASFVNFQGRAYYPFVREKHAARSLTYDPRRPLILTFDFNIAPGTAGVGQELMRPDGWETFKVAPSFTGWIGEVWIPHGSNTPAVCNRLIMDWGPAGKRHAHKGKVRLYGDYTGGSGGTAKVDGTDLDIIVRLLSKVPGWEVTPYWEPNTEERPRVNSVNTRLETDDGTVSMLVDPVHCPHSVLDYEGVMLLEGGCGELLKRGKNYDPDSTHLTDGHGYYVAQEHPVVDASAVVQQI